MELGVQPGSEPPLHDKRGQQRHHSDRCRIPQSDQISPCGPITVGRGLPPVRKTLRAAKFLAPIPCQSCVAGSNSAADGLDQITLKPLIQWGLLATIEGVAVVDEGFPASREKA